MKLKELVSTNSCIGELDVEIRDEHGHLIDKIVIGSRAREDTIKSHDGEPRWKVIRTPINTKEQDSQFWGVILKNIPKDLLNKEVTNWSMWGKAFSLNNGLWEFYELNVTLLGVDKYIETTAKEEPDQLEGQLSLEDFFEKETI